VHLHQNATEGPHVDGQIVGHPQEHLGGAVEATLYVLVYLQKGRKGKKVIITSLLNHSNNFSISIATFLSNKRKR